MRALVLLLALAACAARPEVGPLRADDGPAPVLLPQAEIDARLGTDLSGPATQEGLEARADALRARAAALR